MTKKLSETVPLDLERVERELPKMTSPETVQRRVEIVTNWACAGIVSPGVASAVVRSAEIWNKLADLALDRERVRTFERRIRELEADLKRQQSLGARG